MCCWGHRGGRAPKKKGGERRVGTRARVQSTRRPKMRWIIECGINTANDLGSPPPTPPPLSKKKEKPERREWEKSGERRAKRKRVGGWG